MFALAAALCLTLFSFGGYAAGTLASIGININPIFVGAVGTAALAGSAAIRAPHVLSGLIAPLALWLTMIGGFVSSSRSTNYSDGKYGQLLTLTPLLIAASIILLSIPEVRSRLVQCIVAWGAVVAILQYVTPAVAGNPLTMSAEGSTYQNYGRAVAAAAIILLLIAARRRALSLPLAAFGLGFLWLAVASGSRGPAYMAVLAVFVGFAVLRKSPFVIGTAAVGAFAFAQLFNLYSYLPERLQSFDDTSVHARLSMSELAFKRFVENPTGSGWGGLEPLMATVGPGLVYPHNIFVEVAAEAGLFGLIGLLAYVLYSLAGQLRLTFKTHEAAIFALSIFMIGNASISGDFNSNRGLHLLLAAGIAAWAIRRPEIAERLCEPAEGKDRRALDSTHPRAFAERPWSN